MNGRVNEEIFTFFMTNFFTLLLLVVGALLMAFLVKVIFRKSPELLFIIAIGLVLVIYVLFKTHYLVWDL